MSEEGTRVEYGHQLPELGWVPEYRGIKYATHQRVVHFQVEEPVGIDHWTYADHRHPVEDCQFCADLLADGKLARTTAEAVEAIFATREQARCDHGETEAHPLRCDSICDASGGGSCFTPWCRCRCHKQSCPGPSPAVLPEKEQPR